MRDLQFIQTLTTNFVVLDNSEITFLQSAVFNEQSSTVATLY